VRTSRAISAFGVFILIVRTCLTVIALIQLSLVTSTWGQTPLPGARGLTPLPGARGLTPGPSAWGQTSAAPALTDLSRSLQDPAAKVSPGVVQIFVTGFAPPNEEDRATTGEPPLERSSGSGVIVDPDGYVVTNAHVVENATRIEVELPIEATGGPAGRLILKRRGRIVGAKVIAIDHETDIAVVKVEARGLPALTFGDSDALRSGQLVLAFGSPLGLDSSVSMGVVSAVARQLTPEDPMIYIQTDATINPGNSGGALVDTEGRLVGINALIYSQSGGSEGIGFAAPSNIVRNVFAQIRRYGRVRRGEIGVHKQTITPLLATGQLRSGRRDLRCQRQVDRLGRRAPGGSCGPQARCRRGAADRARQHADVHRVPDGAAMTQCPITG